jgi:UDP-glucose 4-epimerase
VTGGAGYIGSVVVRRLREAGHTTVVVDDLSAGHREAVRGGDLVVGDFGDRALVADLVESRRLEGAVHLAASCLVGESVADPARYYRNNLEKSLVLLDALKDGGASRFVFSCSAAVYGEPVAIPITEGHPTHPTNPYGETKLALERALRWYQAAYGMAFASLRYFNAAGATADGTLGEDHHPETHLVPNVLRAALEGTRVEVFGTDFDTRDGTAVRDYVHVEDLADAHVMALEHLGREGCGSIFNLGNGAGFTVLEVVEAGRAASGRPIAYQAAPRRAGDPASLVASSEKARHELGWSPRYRELGAILETAWRFLLDHRHGYAT